MLVAAKQAQLSGLLSRLPGHVAERLARAIEVDRLAGGTDLPHDDLLRALRAKLREAKTPNRTPQPLRYFCRPFEDLLFDAIPEKKQKGRIARISIEPVWEWLSTELIPERHRTLTAAMSQAILNENELGLHENLVMLWRESAGAIKRAIPTPARKEVVGRVLGSDFIVEDADEIATLISAGTEILVLQSRLPCPIVHLGEPEIRILREAYDRFLEVYPEAAPYLAVLAMARMNRPWEALHLAARLTNQTDDTVISNTDMGMAGEILFAQMDSDAATIHSARPDHFDATALLAALSSFAALSSGIVKELGIRREGKWGQRLSKIRADVARDLDALIERSPKEVLAALPSAKLGSFGKGLKPTDFRRSPDPEKFARAMVYAQLITHSRPFAVAASVNANLQSASDIITTGARIVGENLVKEVRSPRPESKVGELLEPTLNLLTVILGEEEVALLRRRIRIPVDV